MSLQLEARDLAETALSDSIEIKEMQELRDKAHFLINALLAEAARKEPMSAFARADIHECIRRLRFFDMNLVGRLNAAISGAALIAQMEKEREKAGEEGEASNELAPPKVKTKGKKPKQ